MVDVSVMVHHECMTSDITVNTTADPASLTFSCGEQAADAAIIAAGHEPNGYFWEGIVGILDEQLADALDLDSEAGMFCAYGSPEAVTALHALLAPLIESPDAITEVIARAEDGAVEFDD